MTTFDGDEAAWLHTCLLAKTIFRFPWDRADNDYNPFHEPSSDEENISEEESEVIQQVQASRHLQRLGQAHASSCNVRFAATTSTSTSTPMSTSTSTSTSSSTPTSTSTSTLTPTSTSAPAHRALNDVPVNPLQPSRTFDLLESVPSKPWSTNWTPTPGCYSGIITPQELKVEQVYMFAMEGSQDNGLHISSRSLGALADKFRELLSNAAEYADFTEVLQPERSFVMWVQLIS